MAWGRGRQKSILGNHFKWMVSQASDCYGASPFFVSECSLLAVSEAGPALTSLLNGMRHLQDPAEIWGITNHMTISKSCACLDGLSPSVNRTIVDDLDLVHPNE